MAQKNLQRRDQRLQPLQEPLVHAIVAPRPLGLIVDEAGLFEDPQMLGDRGLGHGQRVHQIPAQTAALPQQVQNLHAHGVRQRFAQDTQFLVGRLRLHCSTLLLSTIADRQYKNLRETVKLLGSPPSLCYGDRERLVHRLHLLHETEEAFGQGGMDVDCPLEHGVGLVGEHQRAQNLHQLPSLYS
jgi:hypothetical protein